MSFSGYGLSCVPTLRGISVYSLAVLYRDTTIAYYSLSASQCWEEKEKGSLLFLLQSQPQASSVFMGLRDRTIAVTQLNSTCILNGSSAGVSCLFTGNGRALIIVIWNPGPRIVFYVSSRDIANNFIFFLLQRVFICTLAPK